MGHASEPFAVSCVGFMEPVLVAVPEGCAAYATTRPEYWRHPVSRTFHARDIFAPVAAHLSLGVAPNTVGEQHISTPAKPERPSTSKRRAQQASSKDRPHSSKTLAIKDRDRQMHLKKVEKPFV